MHEILNSFKQKPIPKFQQKLINFEKPQNFSKTPKQSWESLKIAWKEVWSERECLERWKDKSVEREIEKNEREIAIRA